MNKVAVLLSTYNGENYIHDLLDSFTNQNFKDFDLLVRDDGSSDQTINLIKKYEVTSNLNIIFVDSQNDFEVPELSLSASFFKLIKFANKNSNYKYFLFCDQDDIWHENKIQRMLDEIYLAEKNDLSKPLLAHSDLTLIDEQGDFMYASFWKWQGIMPFRNSTSRLLIQNTVTGCATMINRVLSEKLEESPNLYYHDHRAALVASLSGLVIPITESLIKYRQHTKNVSGAGIKNSGFLSKTKYIFSLFFQYLFVSRQNTNINKRIEKLLNVIRYGSEEAKQLLSIYEDDMSKEIKEKLVFFSKIHNYSLYKRLFMLINGKFLPNSFYRSIGLIFVITFYNSKIKKNN